MAYKLHKVTSDEKLMCRVKLGVEYVYNIENIESKEKKVSTSKITGNAILRVTYRVKHVFMVFFRISTQKNILLHVSTSKK